MKHQFHQPRKKFGQHFLTEPHYIDLIIQAINPKQNELLVEIGPGLGALTSEIIKFKTNLHVIEIDNDLVAKLQQQFANNTLKIHHADALKFNFHQLGNSTNPIRVFGNLPYNISTPLLFHLFNYLDCFTDMHFMLQKEVVDRLAAKPNSKQYGRLSVITQYFCHVEKLFDVPAHVFHPPPKVASTVVRLLPHQQPPHPAHNLVTLQHVTRLAFGQRRKTIRNSLKPLLSSEQLIALSFDPTARAEQLSLADFVKISNFLNSK